MRLIELKLLHLLLLHLHPSQHVSFYCTTQQQQQQHKLVQRYKERWGENFQLPLFELFRSFRLPVVVLRLFTSK